MRQQQIQKVGPGTRELAYIFKNVQCWRKKYETQLQNMFLVLKIRFFFLKKNGIEDIWGGQMGKVKSALAIRWY